MAALVAAIHVLWATETEVMMRRARRDRFCWPALVLLVSSVLPAAAAETAFPFDRDLILDAAPMPGSKRIPILQIEDNGAASIDLWCASARGSATIAADAITIVPGPLAPGLGMPNPCPEDRAQRDADLLGALSQVTNWRRNGDVVKLIGGTTLRFMLMTN